MKANLRTITALLLTAALLAPAASASNAMGTELYSYTLDICNQTTLTHQVFWSASKSDLRTENYVTYTPSSGLSPKVSYGSSVLTRQSVSSLGKSLENQGERVLSGVNGDYFDMATGNPLGIVVTDGVLRSSASYLSALGFRSDGSAIIGKPDLVLRADFAGYSLKITDINKTRATGGYYLYTEDYAPTTKDNSLSYDVILVPTEQSPGQTVTAADGTTQLTTSRELGIGRIVPCQVERVIEAGSATAIPSGKFVFTITSTGGEWLVDTLRSLQPGDPVDIEIYSPDPRWNEADCAVGAMFQILNNGDINSDLGLDAPSLGPRTAAGLKPDGTVIFYTMDGRQSGYSVGATMKMVGQRLLELGCTDAVILDGGGSTTMVSTYPDRDSLNLINKPSEGTQRTVTNAVFLTSTLPSTGQLSSLYVTPTSLTLLSGATTQCVAKGMDTGWHQMNLPSAVTWSSPENAVSSTGVFTAPASTGTYTVSAACGEATGSTKITVYSTPTALSVTDEKTKKSVSKLSLSPGDTVNLTASASYYTIPLTATDRCFTWSADPGIGTISADGTFTAGNKTASGAIKVSAGTHAVTIPVSVTAANPFADMGSHWAAEPAKTLYYAGVLTGIQENGKLYFRPNQSITRGDFALMCARWLDADPDSYADTVLPFTDLADIPSWDLNGVKALYQKGIMQGSAGPDGSLRANARSTLTRAEAMTILSRMLEEDLPEASLARFTDAGDVPGWAAPHVARLVGKGIVSGSNGRLNPGSSITRAEVAKLLYGLL